MRILKRHTGNYLEDFHPGQHFLHKHGKTITEGLFQDFCEYVHTTNPLHKNRLYACFYGFRDLVVPPGLVMNVVFSQTVEDISENARANLGYRNMQFGVPVYLGDTIEAESTVLEVRPSSKEQDRGVVSVRTIGRNQYGEIVLAYERSVQIWKRDPHSRVEEGKIELPPLAITPWIPPYDPTRRYSAKAYLSSPHSYFEDFEPDTLIQHSRGRMITEEHIPLTGKLDNTSQLHCNDYLVRTNPEKYIGGRLLVYGGIVFNICLGLSSPDISENALAEVAYPSGRHTGPAFPGDTIMAETQILACEPYPGREDLGLLRTKLIGYKMVEKEGRWERQEVFELFRDLAVKRRSHYT